MSATLEFQESRIIFIEKIIEKVKRYINEDYNELEKSIWYDISVSLEQALTDVKEGVAEEYLDPWIPLTTDRYVEGYDAENLPASDREGRVGVLPLTANPLHWGHIFMALACVS